jgi:type I restriction enzyme S subunit
MLTKHKLRELIDVTRGMSLPGEYYSESGEYIRLTMGNFNYNGGGFKENTSKTDIYYTGPIREEYILNKGDIITPLTEQALGLLGTTAMIPESGKYIQSQDVALITCKEDKIDHLYCYYLISSDLVKKQLSAAAQQTKIRHTSPDKIMDCTVWIPEMGIQQRIGKTLYEIDQKIALNTRMNVELEAMAKQLYDYWFVQFDFPDENGTPYKSSGGEMVYNSTLKREIPAGWEVKSLNQLAQTPKESINPFENPKRDYKHYSIPAYDACGSYLEEKGVFIQSNKFIVNKGQILVPKLNPWYNRVILVDSNDHSICSTEFVILDVIEEYVKGFLFYTVKTDSFISYCTKGSTGTSHSQRRVPPEILKAYNVPYNKDIVSSFTAYVAPQLSMINRNLEEIKQLTHLRDSLLPLLMNGQVTVE